MDKIGASNLWKWQGYGAKLTVDINGKPVESVSGCTRWGGGLWINSQDLARFGLLILNHGNWDARQQIVSPQLAQSRRDPQRARSRLRLSLVAQHASGQGMAQWTAHRALPRSATAAISLWIDPEHDIVLAWHHGFTMDQMVQRIIAAVTGAIEVSPRPGPWCTEWDEIPPRAGRECNCHLAEYNRCVLDGRPCLHGAFPASARRQADISQYRSRFRPSRYPSAIVTVLTSVYCWRPYSPSSRPIPDCLKPPNGAAASNTS